MKKKFFICTTAICLAFAQTAEAQFLKKLGNKIQKKVENVVVEKTADKASKATGKAMDKVFDINFEKSKSGKKITPKDIPASFEFEYLYRLTMTSATTGETAMDMDYYLKPGASYMGVKTGITQDFFMVMDGKTNINYTFMSAGGMKMVTAMALDGDDLSGETDDFDYDSFTLTDLPDKTFLGYTCQGKKMENDDYIFIMYYTSKGPVSFGDVFAMETDRFPAVIRDQFKGNENATLMYMEMKDKVNKGKKNTSGTIECTLLKPEKFTFDTAGYQAL